MRTELTIGEFSRASHLSVKTLRHYHEVGLLEPVSVDPGSGYRRYSEDQIPTAQVIRRLRDLDMPVAEVREVLATSEAPARNALITAHLERLEGELTETRAAVSALRNLLDREQTPLAVEHRTVAPVEAIAIGVVVERGEVLSWWRGALAELHALLESQGLRRAGPSGGLYAGELFQEDRGKATVFIPVEGGAPEIGRVRLLTVPAAELAVVTHRGALTDIDLTYGELGSYAMRHELSVEGPLREYYLRDPQEAARPEDWVTEIGWPIFRADAGRP